MNGSIRWSSGHTVVAAVLSVMFGFAGVIGTVALYWLIAFVVAFTAPFFVGSGKSWISYFDFTIIAFKSMVVSAAIVTILNPFWSEVIWPDVGAFRRFCLTFALGWVFYLLGLGISLLLRFFSWSVLRRS